MINIKKLLGLEEYVSELDQFLMDFDRTHPRLSESQRKEVEKYTRIYRLRNGGKDQPKQAQLWDKF